MVETGKVTRRRIHKCKDCDTMIPMRKLRCVVCAEEQRTQGEKRRKKEKANGSEQVHEGR